MDFVAAAAEGRLICKVCEKQHSKYTCPRCNLRYCSLPCYKGHSLRCTESFMCENVMEEMHEVRATEETQRRMMEMLKRIHFDDSGRSIFEDESLVPDDDSDCDDDSNNGEDTIFSKRTLQLISEGVNLTLDNLGEKERKAFLRALAAGDVSHMIQPWSPWWFNPLARNVCITKQGTALVQSAQESGASSNDEVETDSSDIPLPYFEALPSVRQQTHMEPSPLLPIHLTEVIYAYCFVLRYFNGDWRSEPLEATSALLSVSHILGQAATPESMGTALGDLLKTVCSPLFKHAGGFNFGVALFDDSAAVLRLGRACIICGLADLHRMLEVAKKELKEELRSDKKQGSQKFRPLRSTIGDKLNQKSSVSQRLNRVTSSQENQKQEVKKLEASRRKVYFLMCWANEQLDEIFSSTASAVEMEKRRVLETRPADLGRLMVTDLKPLKREPLIEEVDVGGLTTNNVELGNKGKPLIEEFI